MHWVHSVIYSAIEQVLLNLLRRDVIGETLDMHLCTCFNSWEAADRAGGKLLSTNFSRAPIAAFIQGKTENDTTAERVATEIEEQMNALILDWAAKQAMSKSVSRPSRTDSARSPSSSD